MRKLIFSFSGIAIAIVVGINVNLNLQKESSNISVVAEALTSESWGDNCSTNTSTDIYFIGNDKYESTMYFCDYFTKSSVSCAEGYILTKNGLCVHYEYDLILCI